MKKITQVAETGGARIDFNDFRDVFNDEIWDAIEAIFSPYNTDTEGVIISGCVVGGSGPSSYTLSAGIVYLGGEFMRVSAASGLSLPQYIKAATAVNTTRTFEDTTIKTLYITHSADLSGSIPGAGQYVSITTTTDPDDRRLISEIKGQWTPISNFSTGWTGTCFYRIEKSGRVSFRGFIHATAPSATSTITPDATVPNAITSSKHVIYATSPINEYTAILQINTNGGISVLENFVSDSDYFLDSVNYFNS